MSRFLSTLPRSVILLVLLLIATMAVGVTGVQSADRDPASPEPARERDETAEARLAEQRAEERRRAAERATPEATAERERSRTAFKGLGRDEALALARRHHGRIVEAPVIDSLPLRRGESLRRHLDSHNALVNMGGGKAVGLFTSTLPMLVKGEPFSLELRESGDSLVPENGVSAVRIAKDARGGVRLAAGVGFAPSGAAEAPAEIVAGKAFHGGGAPGADADYLVEAVPGGARAMFVLRSEDSSQAPALDFDLPDGAVLRPLEDGAVVSRGDDVLATISPPAASDADHVVVPTRYVVDGDRLTTRVAHREGDFRYPILVDPQVVNDQQHWNCGGYQCVDTNGWYKVPDPALTGFGIGTPGSDARSWWRGWALYTWINQDASVAGGLFADWRFRPHNESHIFRWDAWSSHSPARSFISEGLWDPHLVSPMAPDGDWRGEWHLIGHAPQTAPYANAAYDLYTQRTHCADWVAPLECHWADGGTNLPAKPAYVSHRLTSTGGTGPQATAVLEGSVIGQWDLNDPEIHRISDTIPSGWVRHAEFDVHVEGRDRGLGVSRVGTDAPGHAEDDTHPCGETPNPGEIGDRNHRCPAVFPKSFHIRTADPVKGEWGEGEHTFRAYADDIILRPRAHTEYKVRLDRSGPPTIALSGALKNLNDKTVTGSAPLTVSASDDKPPVNKTSGVKRLELWVDGRPPEAEKPGSQTIVNSAGSCDSCELVGTLDFDAADYEDGRHTAQVKAWDYAGNESASASLTFITDTRGPAASATAHTHARTGWVDTTTAGVELRGNDSGSGVASVELDETADAAFGAARPSPADCGVAVAPACLRERIDTPTDTVPQGILTLTGLAHDAVKTDPAGLGRGLRADIYSGSGLSGTPLVATSSRIDYDWGTSAPAPGVSSDFSVRWTGQIRPRYTQTYTFRVLADDTSRLVVNGTQLFNESDANDVDTGTIALEAGKAYDILLEVADLGHDARARLEWESASQPLEVVPPDRLHHPVKGAHLELFDEKEFAGAAYRRIGAMPAASWAAAPDVRMGAEGWSARYTAQVTPRYTGTYTFYTRSDDGVRLFVDGKKLLAHWAGTANNAVVERSGTVSLTAGRSYDLRLEYFDETGSSNLALEWASPQQTREAVPAGQLTPQGGRTAPWTLKVDRDNPVVAPLTGPLVEQADEYLEGPTEVDFDATDGADTAPRSQRSGVKRWNLLVGAATNASNSRTTVADSQPWSDTAIFKPGHSSVLDGLNTVTLRAQDQLDHAGSSPTTIQVYGDRTPPALATSGSLKEAEGQSVWEGTFSLGARANDGAFDSPRSGVKRLEYFLGRLNADGSVSDETSVHKSEPRPGSSPNLLPNSSAERMWGTGGVPFRWGFRADISRVADAGSIEHGAWAGRITARETGDALMISDSARISVQPGDELTLSGHLRASTGGRSAHIAPRWWNASGQMFSESNAQFKAVSTSRSRYSASWVAPDGATSMGWKVAMKGHAVGDHMDVDALQIERGATATEYAPRSTINLFTNTSFERVPGAAGTPLLGKVAATYDRVQDPAAVEHGGWAVRLRPNATNDAQLLNDAEKVPVTPGEKLSFSAFMRASAAGATAWVHPRWFDANGVFMGQHSPTRHPIATTRAKYAGSWTVPAGAAHIGWAVTMTGHNGATATPTTLDIDAVQVERGVDHSEYLPLTSANVFANTSFERPSGQDGAPTFGAYLGTWARIEDAASLHHGRYAARLTASSTVDAQLINDADQVPVRWGERLTFSGYARSSAAQGTWVVSPRWRNEAGMFLGQHDASLSWQPMTTSRKRFSGTVTVPPGATRVSWVVTMRGHAAGQSLDVDGIQAERGEYASVYRQPRSTEYAHSAGWTFDPSQHEPGRYRVRIRATDHLGYATDSNVTVDVDSPPELSVEGGLRSSPLATGRDLQVTATDGDNGVRDIRIYRKAATGLEPVGGDPGTELHAESCAEPNPCSTLSTSFELPDTTPSGRYEFAVVAKDKVGRPADERWIAEIVQTRSGQNEKLGLEQWFDLDETDTGGDASLYVNGETGNVVWHQVPIVNPGRGLSSVVNVTYNSHARGGTLGVDATRIPAVGINPEDDSAFGRDLSGYAYDQAGVGFSVAIAGPTRVNDPLGGVVAAGAVERQQAQHDTPWPGEETQATILRQNGLALGSTAETRITLTDADGTQHTFRRRPGETRWSSPPGLNMRLRYHQASRGTGLLPQLTAADLAQDVAWELVRPDGVKFSFDSFGYQRRTVDRNQNALTYDYKAYSSLTGQECAATELVGRIQADGGLCFPQLQEVRQPTWAQQDDPGTRQDERTRKISLVYTPVASSGDLPTLMSSFGLPPGTLIGASRMMGGGRRIASITDAAGLVYRFDYHDSTALGGYLAELTENAADPVPSNRRVTRFKYCEGAPCASLGKPRQGDAHQLTDVVPVVGGVERQGTRIEYPARDATSLLPPAPRPASRLVKRGGGTKLLRYLPDDDLHGDRFTVHERVLGTRYLTRQSELDAKGRPLEIVESASDLANESPDTAAQAVPAQGETKTRLTWHDGENKPASVVEAPGTGGQRTTAYTYLTDGTGALASQTVSGTGGDHVTSLTYYDDARTADFIADLRRITLPGGREWEFESNADGNVHHTTTPAERRMKTDFGPGGVVTRQEDEQYAPTRFEDHDLGGNPETVILPPDAGQDERRYAYRYDERGDVTTIVDPRGDVRTTDGDPMEVDEGDPYVTTLRYDAFARLVREHIPRNSGGAAGAGNGDAFVIRSRKFDRNGNVDEMTDERSATTHIGYDAMDQPIEVKRPGSRDVDAAAGEPLYPPEITRFVYDDAQRMIAETRPRGASASADAGFASGVRGEHLRACETADAPQGERPFTTRYCRDHRGRPLALVGYSTRSGELARRIVTFRYDERGNTTRLADANRNAEDTQDGGQTPLNIAVAQQPAQLDSRHRVATEYDALDRPTVQTVRPRPGDDADPLTRTFHYADDVDRELDRIVDGAGAQSRIVRMDHDAMGRLVFRTDYPEGEGEGRFGRTTCIQRRHDGLVTAVATPRAATTQAQCRANHDFGASTTEYQYDAVGDVLSRTVPRAAEEDGFQYGPQPDTAGEWRVRYDRDVVGNAERIFDARGNAIDNTFFDGGELASTTRPSFFAVEWPGAPSPRPGSRYRGGDAADVEVGQGGPAVVEREERSANAERSEERPALPTSLGKGDLGDVAPEALPGWLPQAGATRLRYDNAMQLTSVLDAVGEARTVEYDPAGRVERKTLPMVAENPTQAGTQKREIVHDFEYDTNGNLTAVREDWDAERVDTTFEYDGYDRRVTEIAEGAQSSPSDPLSSEITRFAYDANDNVRFRVTPRPVAPGSAERLKFEFDYDSRDQLRFEHNPAGETWEYRYNEFAEVESEIAPRAPGALESLHTTTLGYDRAGQLVSRKAKVNVPGETAHDVTWDYAYDADGNLEETTAPGSPERVRTRVEHDGRGLPWRSTVQGVNGGKRRVTITEYDANGNLRRSVKPTGIDPSDDRPKAADNGTEEDGNLAAASENATVFTYDEHDLLVKERLPWRGSGDRKLFREWQREGAEQGHRQRFITAINHPRTVGGSDPEWGTLYDQNAAGWVIRLDENTRTRESDEPFTPSVRYAYDAQGQQTLWRAEHAHQSDTGRDIRRTYWPNGLVRRRTGIKTIDRTTAEDDPNLKSRRHYDYYYNPNRSLVEVVDDDANRVEDGDQRRTTRYRRDHAEREEHIDEDWPKGKDVELRYEPGSGRLVTRRTDGVFDANDTYSGDERKTTSFTYDSLGRELRMEVQPHGRPLRTTSTRWHDSGLLATRTKPNQTVEEWDWDVFGRQDSHVRRPSGRPAEEQDYDYDDDGNRTQDERGEHEFNARDQLIRWTRPLNARRGDRAGWTTKYTRYPSGEIDVKTEHPHAPDGQPLPAAKVTHDHDYELPDGGSGDRLTKLVTTNTIDAPPTSVTTQTFGYDVAGNVARVRSHTDVSGNVEVIEPPAGETALDPEECLVPPDTSEVGVTRYCYDEFDRQIMSWGKGVESPSHITYDGLDRRDVKRIADDEGGDTERRDYSYIGSSELLTSESVTTSGSTASPRRLSFDYDSRGSREGIQKEQGASFGYSEYTKDANGSVLALEEDDGSILAGKRYDYDPYGELDREAPDASTGAELEDGLDEDAKDNPFRFQGFYYDSGVKTYDMHARHYRPEIGRFLSRDQFASAAGDMAMQADPLTQNRYAFAGGNPVTNVEFDGHVPGPKDGGIGGPRTAEGRPTTKANRSSSPGSATRPLLNTALHIGDAVVSAQRPDPNDVTPMVRPPDTKVAPPLYSNGTKLTVTQRQKFYSMHHEGHRQYYLVKTPEQRRGLSDFVEGLTTGLEWLAPQSAVEAAFVWNAPVRTVGRIAAKIPRLFKRSDVAAKPATDLFDGLTHANQGIRSYAEQAAVTRGKRGEIQAHHLIEKRFARQMGSDTNEWPSIVATRAEHQAFTNAWRREIAYGAGTRTATRAEIHAAARRVYADYPAILRALER